VFGRIWQALSEKSRRRKLQQEDLLKALDEIQLSLDELRQEDKELRHEIQGLVQSVAQLSKTSDRSVFSFDRVTGLLFWIFPFGVVVASASNLVFTGISLVRNETSGQPLEPWLSFTEVLLSIALLVIATVLAITLRRIPETNRHEPEYERLMCSSVWLIVPASVPAMRWVNIVSIKTGIDDILFDVMRSLSIVFFGVALYFAVLWLIRRKRRTPPLHQSEMFRWATPNEFLSFVMSISVSILVIMVTVNPLSNVE